MEVSFKRYFLYLIRWQLSTPILAIALIVLSTTNKWTATIIANLIGGLIFFWVDRFIFTSKKLGDIWEVREEVICSDCGKVARGYRLVKSMKYDKTRDIKPKFRCEECSKKKSEDLKRKGAL